MQKYDRAAIHKRLLEEMQGLSLDHFDFSRATQLNNRQSQDQLSGQSLISTHALLCLHAEYGLDVGYVLTGVRTIPGFEYGVSDDGETAILECDGCRIELRGSGEPICVNPAFGG